MGGPVVFCSFWSAVACHRFSARRLAAVLKRQNLRSRELPMARKGQQSAVGTAGAASCCQKRGAASCPQFKAVASHRTPKREQAPALQKGSALRNLQVQLLGRL